MTPSGTLHAGIDAGGTTFKCGLADASCRLVASRRVPVARPSETLAACLAWLRSAAPEGAIATLGIASFGPVDVDPASPAYGTLLATPKPHWQGIDLRAPFCEGLGLTPVIDTDVNGALLAEMQMGAARGAASAAYVTIGTGIGAAVFTGGAMIARPLHPEFGHIPAARHRHDHAFEGVCPFHGDCLEGLASAPAMRARYGEPATLPEDHPGWEIEADYLAQACQTLSLIFRPDRIVLGGGLMLAPHLIGRVRAAYTRRLAGYAGQDASAAAALISTPGLGDQAGLIGAILLGQGTAPSPP